MAHGADPDGVLVLLIEEYAVVAAAKTKPLNGGLSFFKSPVRFAK